MEQAIRLEYEAINDESTVCHFCPNECSRTFIDTRTPDGRTSRYISGFSCEKGTVESKEALKELHARAQRAQAVPQPGRGRGEALLHPLLEPEPLPPPERLDDVEVHRRSLFWWSGGR
jgi:hypothetical protein